MSGYEWFVQKVKQKTCIDLSLYKEAQMKRRLTSLYRKRKYENFVEYFYAIDKKQELMDEFLDYMTINVSKFYRDLKSWILLDEKIIPLLKEEFQQLKAWSAGCSMGEEAYSLATVVLKHISLQDVQIEATDINKEALKRAKTALYSKRAIKNVPRDIVARYFTKDGNYYRVIDEIKRAVTFHQHNLLEDSYGNDYELIICRNVMIYFTKETKEQIYYKLSQALRPGGILFVGNTERILYPERYKFRAIDNCFYQKVTSE